MDDSGDTSTPLADLGAASIPSETAPSFQPIPSTCKVCGTQFIVNPEDLEFYQKVSPTFAGKTYQIPPPTHCPQCRLIRRMVWRNERNFYKRKCDKSGREIVTIYSPDKTDYKVYGLTEWWADDWDAMSYGQDVDLTRSFFEQFNELMHKVPRLALFNTKTENCEYANYIAEAKDCYMSSIIYYGSQGVHYSYFGLASKNSIDLHHCDKAENCYELSSSNSCYNCRYSNRLSNCRNVFFSQDLNGCSDCILSNNLSHKQYYIRNQPYSKEEYEKKLAEMNLGSAANIKKYLEEYQQLRSQAIVKYANLLNSEDCEGDDIANSKDAKNCYSALQVEHSRYSSDQEQAKYTWDSEGGAYEWTLECNNSGFGNNHLGCSSVYYSNFIYYSENCHNSHDLFGCVGLRNKQYCIFNKQYTKEEYERLVGQLIEKMQADGQWGQFFPMEVSPFGYNETLVNDFYPKTQSEAEQIGAKWLTQDYSIQYPGPFYEPKDDIKDYHDNEAERQALLSGILKCEVSGKAYKIIPQELAFYLEQGIPIPRKHYNVRYKERFALRNPMVLYDRECMCAEATHDHTGSCPVIFKTTYAPERTEKVYCERCYQKVTQ